MAIIGAPEFFRPKHRFSSHPLLTGQCDRNQDKDDKQRELLL